MKSNKVYGHLKSFIRCENDFFLTLETEFLCEKDGKIEKTVREIDVIFYIDKPMIKPFNNFEQTCMLLLEEYTDTTIILENNDLIREQYLIGKLIDNVALDIISKTNLTTYYESIPIFSTHELN